MSSNPSESSEVPFTPASEISEEQDDQDLQRIDRAEEEEEEEGEDLLDDNMLNDYKAVPELDRYDEADLDEQEYESIDYGARRRAEAEMRKRDREMSKRGGRIPAALATPEDEEELPARRRRRIADGDDGELIEEALPEGSQEEPVEYVNLDDYQGPLKEWLQIESTRREIKRRFRQFLQEYTGPQDDEENENANGVKSPKEKLTIYPAQIISMCRANKASLEVSFLHLSDAIPILAVWVADEPETILELFDEEATEVTINLYQNYDLIHPVIHVRITQLPIVDRLRDLRHHHLGALTRVEGVVTRRTGVFPQMKIITFICVKCKTTTPPYTQTGQVEVSPGRCPECQSTGPFTVDAQNTIYRNYQKITLQEAPGSVPAGRVPRTKDVVLLHDLIDTVSPGELVDITGIYKHTYDDGLNRNNGFPVFATVIQAVHVSKQAASMTSFRVTDEDIKEIRRLSKEPNIAEKIINSIGPSIYGHQDVKTALALSMFSGVPKQLGNEHRIRGDINVLVLGDPGVAKSQFLKYVEKTAHRTVYTTGKGASAVGLTASVHRDPLTREWTLEGGALVLADQGICCIDEFDKMNDADRTSIHEAMEQQSISISKAGIITTLKARCAVVAAANPVMGRYDSSRTFAENVELTDAILSRFDILCVVRDQVDLDVDSRLASFVVDSHMRAMGPTQKTAEEISAEHNPNKRKTEEELKSEDPAYNNPNMIPQRLLRKYILYAREHCHPKLNRVDDDKIAKLYADLRRESMVTGGIPIAVRHIESIIRMSEAHAKMHLRENVIEEDINMAIRVMLESFISSQKFSVMRPLRLHFDKYLTYKKDHFELLFFLLKSLVDEALHLRMLRGKTLEESKLLPVEVALDDFRQKALELNISNLEPFFQSHLFKENQFSINLAKKTIVKTYHASSSSSS